MLLIAGKGLWRQDMQWNVAFLCLLLFSFPMIILFRKGHASRTHLFLRNVSEDVKYNRHPGNVSQLAPQICCFETFFTQVKVTTVTFYQQVYLS